MEIPTDAHMAEAVVEAAIGIALAMDSARGGTFVQPGARNGRPADEHR